MCNRCTSIFILVYFIFYFAPQLIAVTVITNPVNNYLNILCFITFRQAYFRRYNIIQTNSGITVAANKMHMIVVVMVFAAVFTQGIQYSVISSGYSMYNTFFYKRLQGAVYGNTVKFFACLFFNIGMCQCIFMR